jgi:Icc-related predicted phosphoesterase
VSDLVLACIGDVHAQLDRLRVVIDWLANARVDGILFVGDFAPGPHNPPAAGSASPLDASIALARTITPDVLLVPGNHDEPDVGVSQNVDRQLRHWLGLRVYGLGGGGPDRFGFPYEWSDEEIAAVDVPPCDILLSHTPPRGCALDRIHKGRHVGSASVRAKLGQCSGVFLCGHIHEAVGQETVDGCLCYNAGSLGAPFGAVQVGLLRHDAAAGSWNVSHHLLET